MIEPAKLRAVLAGTPYEVFLGFDPFGLQIPSFIAVAQGHKPAMDAWVRVEAWAAFNSAMTSFGLVHVADTLFDRADERLDAVANDRFGSTRAALRRLPVPGAEAHVFVAADTRSRDYARASGWYPLLVDGILIDKPPSDHERFGSALGYPACCRTFFRQRNDWRKDNSWCAAAMAAAFEPPGISIGAWQANGLLRHSAAGLVPHIPCSPECVATIEAANSLYADIRMQAPEYADAIRHELSGVFLVLSEERVFRLENAVLDSRGCRYSGVKAVNPTSVDDPLLPLLEAGYRCDLENGCVLAERDARPTGGYQGRGDQHAPECPILIQYR